MKALFKFVIFLCCLCVTALANETIQREKVVKSELNVGKGDRLLLTTPYGDVVVRTWKKQQVSVRFVATGIGYPNELIDSLFRNTDVSIKDHENGSDKIEVVPKLQVYGKGNSVNGIADAKGNVVELALRYELMVPEDMFLDLDVKYGNVTFEDPYKGPVNVRIWGGQLFAKTLSGKANHITIEPPYPLKQKNHIGYLRNGYLNFAPYMDIDSAGDIKVNYCRDLNIGKADMIYLAGKNNDLKIGKVNYLYGTLEKTEDVTIGDITRSSDLFLTHSRNITFSRLYDVGHVHIHGMESTIQLGYLDNVTLDIHNYSGIGDLDDRKIEHMPKYLHKNKKRYSATLGNGNGTVDIEGDCTVSFMRAE